MGSEASLDEIRPITLQKAALRFGMWAQSSGMSMARPRNDFATRHVEGTIFVTESGHA